jgi:hypothetical protein
MCRVQLMAQGYITGEIDVWPKMLSKTGFRLASFERTSHQGAEALKRPLANDDSNLLVNDICALIGSLDLERLFPNIQRLMVGPEYEVQGMPSEADLPLNSCLMEIKTGMDGGLSRATEEQLLIYVLLAAISGLARDN